MLVTRKGNSVSGEEEAMHCGKENTLLNEASKAQGTRHELPASARGP